MLSPHQSGLMAGTRRRSLHTIPSEPESLRQWTNDLTGQGVQITMDEFLKSEDLHRYHLPVDGCCLFRAVSETIYNRQNRHQDIRESCCDYILANWDKVKEFYKQTDAIEEHVERLRRSEASATNPEMRVLSLMYEVDFIIYFRADTDPVAVTQNGFPKTIHLCWSHGDQFDLVYSKSRIEALTVTQSIVYNILYKEVFELGAKEVDFAVHKMLYDKDNFKTKRHLTFTQWCQSVKSGGERSIAELPEHKGKQIVLAVRNGVPPFPFKVAKCLDREMFRNVDYLNWCEVKREELRRSHQITPDLGVGVKCIANIEAEEHMGFVQSIDEGKNSAQVFLQSVGQLRNIPIDDLKAQPVSKVKDDEDTLNMDPSDKSSCYLKTSTPNQNRNRSRSAGDALIGISHEQFTALSECSLSHDTPLKGIPEQPNSYPRKGNNYRSNEMKPPHTPTSHHRRSIPRRGSLNSESLCFPGHPNTSPRFQYFAPAPVQPLFVQPTSGFPTTPEAMMPPQPQFLTAPAPEFVLPTVSVTFDPSKPPPPAQYAEPNEYVVGPLLIRGPNVDVSGIRESVHIDGSDLPTAHVSIMRYFFNLGVLTYKNRKRTEKVDQNDSGFQAQMSSSIMMPPACPVVTPQQNIIYSPGYVPISPTANSYYQSMVGSYSDYSQSYDASASNIMPK